MPENSYTTAHSISQCLNLGLGSHCHFVVPSPGGTTNVPDGHTSNFETGPTLTAPLRVPLLIHTGSKQRTCAKLLRIANFLTTCDCELLYLLTPPASQ